MSLAEQIAAMSLKKQQQRNNPSAGKYDILYIIVF